MQRWLRCSHQRVATIENGDIKRQSVFICFAKTLPIRVVTFPLTLEGEHIIIARRQKSTTQDETDKTSGDKKIKDRIVLREPSPNGLTLWRNSVPYAFGGGCELLRTSYRINDSDIHLLLSQWCSYKERRAACKSKAVPPPIACVLALTLPALSPQVVSTTPRPRWSIRLQTKTFI